MTAEHCENTARFAALETAVAGIKAAADASAKSQEVATEEIRSLGRELRNLLGDLRERSARDSQKVEGLEKGVSILFQFKRDIEDNKLPAIKEQISLASARSDVRITDVLEKRIMPIEIQHLKEAGASAAFRDLRVLLPSAIAVLLGIIQLWQAIKPWLLKLTQQ